VGALVYRNAEVRGRLCYVHAGTCVDLANKATSDEDKKHLLAMAEPWLGLADRVQRPGPEPDASSLHPALRAKFG
jgi:hypothetical protein